MTVQLSRIGELALITLDRPEVLNALNFELLRDLGAAIDQVADGEARALLVTGAGSRPRPHQRSGSNSLARSCPERDDIIMQS